MSINDFLHPITELRQIKRIKFDLDSPRFQEACKRLEIDQEDLQKRKLHEFENIVRNEKPEEEQNPVLVRELATIKFNYYLTTFKEIFNDVIDERRHIVNEERAKVRSFDRDMLTSREATHIMRTEDLMKSKS